MEDITQRVDNQLGQIQRLMAALDIKDDESPNEVIFDYQTDDEVDENPYEQDQDTNPFLVKQEDFPEESSKRKYGYDRNQYTYPGTKDTFSNARETVRTFDPAWNNTKFRKINPQYVPKIGNSMDGVLNIDCVLDMKATINDWYAATRALVGLEPRFKELGISEVYHYLVHKMSGICREHFLGIENIKIEFFMTSKDKIDLVDRVYKEILREFTGGLEGSRAEEDEVQKSYWHIANMSICNMCYLDSFLCEYKEHYYRLDKPRKELAEKLFFTKFPETVGTLVSKLYEDNVRELKISPTLGGAIETIKQWLKEQCLKKTRKREAKITLCCDKSGTPGQYGCDKTTRKRRKKKAKWLKVPKKYYKEQKKSRKRFFKKKTKPYKKHRRSRAQDCPTGKKSCRCWLCQEEGHYANECPKKAQKPEGLKALRMAYDIGYIPVESDIDTDSSDIEIYMLDESETESSEEDSD
ncbi:coat protein [Soymovirus malvae]|nr:coat protein [Malva associated soymovirus 1]